MKLHGNIMHISPGAQLAPGVCDLTWRIYETKPGGITSVEKQIASDWTYERLQFGFGDDLQDYCGLHGLYAYVRTNMPVECGKSRLGKNLLAGDFILCGQLFGVATPFHTEEQAREIIQWFLSKQVQWHAIYSEQADGETPQDAEASKANTGSGSSKRGSRPRLH